jgi:hypothetical protein
MKKLFTQLMVISITFSLFAQPPQKMSYQCVVRNSTDALVTNQSVAIRISILQGTISGTAVYQEAYNPNPQTNANGLLSLEIGSGLAITGTFSEIDWSSGPYFLKTETDPAGGTNYTIIGTSQLLSVPYAMYAKTAGNSFSGNYYDLTNKPILFSGNYYDLTNIPILFDGTWGSLTGKPILAAVSTSGNYNDLTNKPTLFNGSWANLSGKPTSLAGYGITDGISTSHASYGITSSDIANWTNAYNWGNHATFGYLKSVSIPNQMTGDIMYYNGTNWVRLPKGTTGQILAMNSSGQPAWTDMFGSPITATEAATNVRETSVTLNCTVNSRGLSTTIEFEYGIDISYGSKVSILQNPIIGNSSVFQSVNVYDLLDGRTYHFRVKAVNTYGTTYGEDMTFSTNSINEPFSIGKIFGGGVIFYLDNTGQHGLICATSDQIQGVRWNNGTVLLIGTSTLVGTGQSNTSAIVNAQGAGIYAASICDQLVLNGYTDWFLPSIDELQLIYNQKAVIGGFTGPYEYYWSSSEYITGSVFLWSMVQGGRAWAGTYDTGASVRAIRAF